MKHHGVVWRTFNEVASPTWKPPSAVHGDFAVPLMWCHQFCPHWTKPESTARTSPLHPLLGYLQCVQACGGRMDRLVVSLSVGIGTGQL